MKQPHFSIRWMKGTYRGVGVVVRAVFLLATLAALAFVYLRLYGVPQPLLQKVVNRINAAGIPVEIESMTLTLKGWRADRVKYYSRNPDDLEALFDIDHVYFDSQKDPWNGPSSGLLIDVQAQGVRINPSLEWGLDIPVDNPVRYIEVADVTLSFQSDQIEVHEGTLNWLGGRFRINGTVLKYSGRKKKRKPIPSRSSAPHQVQDTLSPVRLTAEQFGRLEARLKALNLSQEVEVDIDFIINMNNYSASRFDFSVQTDELQWRGIPFSGLEIAGSYAYPQFELQRAALYQEKLSAQLNGTYNQETTQVEGSLFNMLQSNRLLLLLPEKINSQMVEMEIKLEQLPRAEVSFGPSPLTNALRHVTGSFVIRDTSYKEITAEVLSGKVERSDGRLEFTDLQAVILGRETETGRTGSSMRGGSAEGHFFWDTDKQEMGIGVEGSFDPNLLVEALAPVKVANRVIQRFRFRNQAPRIRVEIASNTRDWKDFQIEVNALSNDAMYEGVLCSSINVNAFYQFRKLKLDPVAVMQGSRFAKGSALIDFREVR